MRGMREIGLMMSAAVAAGLLGVGAAAASTLPPAKPNYIFPDGFKGFALVSSGGLINPGVLVGFNPQPDPPGIPLTTLNLEDPFRPVLFNGALGDFGLEFTLTGLGAFTLPTPDAPNADGDTGIEFITGGHTIDVTFHIGPGPVDGSWVGFNPQPDPPGDATFGVKMTFPQQVDPMASFGVAVDGTNLSFALAPSGAPEPAAWALMLVGFGGLGVALRARRRPTLA